MTWTELFRDFLIENKAKNEFIRMYKINSFLKALKHKYDISFKDDFLRKSLFFVDPGRKPFDFLKPRYFITWDDEGKGYEFWDDLNKKWEKRVIAAIEKGLIDELH